MEGGRKRMTFSLRSSSDSISKVKRVCGEGGERGEGRREKGEGRGRERERERKREEREEGEV